VEQCRRNAIGTASVQQRARGYGIAGIDGQLGQHGICKLRNLKSPVGFESHPLRHHSLTLVLAERVIFRLDAALAASAPNPTRSAK
jgi:hypothetical protein